MKFSPLLFPVHIRHSSCYISHMKRDTLPPPKRNVTIALRGNNYVYFFNNDLQTSHVMEVRTLHDWKPVISDWILRGTVPEQATSIKH